MLVLPKNELCSLTLVEEAATTTLKRGRSVVFQHLRHWLHSLRRHPSNPYLASAPIESPATPSSIFDEVLEAGTSDGNHCSIPSPGGTFTACQFQPVLVDFRIEEKR